MKIVINECFGGFVLSNKAVKRLSEITGRAENGLQYVYMNERTAQELIQVVEELDEEASSTLSNLEVVDIPDDATDWEIEEYDGYETIIAVIDGKIKRFS